MDYEKITLRDVENIAGHGKKQGREWVFRCPLCAATGNDKHGDNLKFNEDKGVLYCFASDYHSTELCKEIYKNNKPEPMPEIPQWQTDQKKYLQYMISCNAMLLGNWGAVNKEIFIKGAILRFMGQEKSMLDYLYQKRKIKPSTVNLTGLGFDFEDDKWVIPVFNNNKIKGFEYRKRDFDLKIITREFDTPKCMAWIYGGSQDTDTLYICEGFFDSYIMLQWLLENKQKKFSIATPSNGCGSLMYALTQVQFNKYKKIKLIMDNDKAGDEVTKEAIKKYPFLLDARRFLKSSNTKDISDYYAIIK